MAAAVTSATGPLLHTTKIKSQIRDLGTPGLYIASSCWMSATPKPVAAMQQFLLHVLQLELVYVSPEKQQSFSEWWSLALAQHDGSFMRRRFLLSET